MYTFKYSGIEESRIRTYTHDDQHVLEGATLTAETDVPNTIESETVVNESTPSIQEVDIRSTDSDTPLPRRKRKRLHHAAVSNEQYEETESEGNSRPVQRRRLRKNRPPPGAMAEPPKDACDLFESADEAREEPRATESSGRTLLQDAERRVTRSRGRRLMQNEARQRHPYRPVSAGSGGAGESPDRPSVQYRKSPPVSTKWKEPDLFMEVVAKDNVPDKDEELKDIEVPGSGVLQHQPKGGVAVPVIRSTGLHGSKREQILQKFQSSGSTPYHDPDPCSTQ